MRAPTNPLPPVSPVGRQGPGVAVGLAADVDNVAWVLISLMNSLAKRMVDPEVDPHDARRIALALDNLGAAFAGLGDARSHLLGDEPGESA